MRPEYIVCIKKDDSTWCGRNEPFSFRFQSIDHAALERLRGGRLLVCPECSEKIKALL